MPQPGNDSGPSALVSLVAEALSDAAEQIRTAPVRGAMAPLYVQGVVLEVMARLLDLINRDDSELAAPPQTEEHRSVGTARTILMSNLTNPPTMEDLARQVGLSQRRLNEVFRQTFGVAPYQCLKNWRLDQARLLLERGDMAVKQIAHQMGYAHVSSFTHAYTRRFGTPPSRYGKPADIDGGSREI